MSNILNSRDSWKKVVYRIIFYSLFLLLLISIPLIYRLFFMNYEIEMLIFYSPLYIFWELMAIISAVYFAEYYLFPKLMKVGIEKKKERNEMMLALIAFLFFTSKTFAI